MSELILTKEQLADFARDFTDKLEKSPDKATIVALSGELGAGKTFFTQNLAKALGIEITVKSPTFVIEKIYDLSGQKWAQLVHIDAYRLEAGADLESIGWSEIIKNPNNLVVVEWPEKIAGAIPSRAIFITFETLREDQRKITYDQN